MPSFKDSVDVQGAATISGNAQETTQVIKLASGQTQPFLELEDQNGNVLSALDTTGKATGALAAQFDSAGSASNAQANAEAASLPKSGGTMSGAIAMGSNKITGLANGTASTDGAAFGQIPLAGTSTPNMDGTGSTGSATTWSKSDHVHPTDTSRAPVASPTFTGTPAAPTAAADTSTTQLATTAFVIGQASSTTPVVDGTGTVGTSDRYARADHVHPTDTSRAPLASPTFTGIVTAPEFTASGLTGATAASRYVGATTSGAPASGTFAVGDFIIDQTGAIYVCTTAGTPGTWTKVGGSGGSGLAEVATTGTSGYALTNGTGTIISWTTPNDGNLHYAFLVIQEDVTSATTGGYVNFAFTAPGGAQSNQVLAGTQSTGWKSTSSLSNCMAYQLPMSPNTTVSVLQTSAVTAGAATVYATIYGA